MVKEIYEQENTMNALSEIKDLRKLVEADRTWMEKEIIKMDKKIQAWTLEIIRLGKIVQSIEYKINLPAQRYYNEVHIESPQVINKILAIEAELNIKINAVSDKIQNTSLWEKYYKIVSLRSLKKKIIFFIGFMVIGSVSYVATNYFIKKSIILLGGM